MRVLPRSSWGKGLALLAVVLIALDVFTVWGSCTFGFRGRSHYYVLGLRGGALQASYRPGEGLGFMHGLRFHPAWMREWWIDVDQLPLRGPAVARYVGVPLWMLTALVIGVHGGAALFRQSRKPRRGLCTHCGYDLAGLPPEAVCPECGRARA